jgi:outer membrane protein assembly factor BamA
MWRLLLILVAALVLCVDTESAAAIPVRSEGDFSASRIRRLLESAEIGDLDSAAIFISDTLCALGYFGVTVVADSDTFEVSSGAQFSFGNGRLLGDSTLLPVGMVDRLPLRSGVPFESWRIEASIDEILSWCENHGYPFAQIELDSIAIDFELHRASAHLKFLAGPQISIEFLEFQGNSITLPKLLERESKLRIGSPYSENRAKLAQRRLQHLEYLRTVSNPQIVVNDAGQSGVLYNVTESKLSRLDAVAGLTPKVEGESQTITGLIDLQFLNLFGTGRRGKVFWQRPNKGIQELSLAWREAWILGTPFYVDGTFEQRVEDTLYVTRSFGARAGYPVSSTMEVFGGIAREELLADSLTAAQFGFVTNQTVLFEIGTAVDTRDHATNPRGGIRFETTAARGARTTDLPPEGSTETSFEQRRATVDIEVNREIRSFWIAYVSGHARVLNTDEPKVQAADKYRLGGARTLRGYREEQFQGEQIAWANVEARYWLGPASRLALFTDWGTVYNSSTATSGSSTLIEGSYGVGMRLETGIGVWGIDYGIATGSSPLNGQLHVSLLSLF